MIIPKQITNNKRKPSLLAIQNSVKARKGKKLSEEHKAKLKLVRSNMPKEKMYTPERGVKISTTLKRLGIKPSFKGHKHSEETKRKIGLINIGNKNLLGFKFSEKSKEKMRLSHLDNQKGENNPNWRGGLSKNPYPSEFNKKLKLKIKRRDNFTCCLCNKTEREELEELNRVLCVNHIDFNKNNCKENNLNTLCLRCNVKINRERDYWTNYFNNL